MIVSIYNSSGFQSSVQLKTLYQIQGSVSEPVSSH